MKKDSKSNLKRAGNDGQGERQKGVVKKKKDRKGTDWQVGGIRGTTTPSNCPDNDVRHNYAPGGGFCVKA